MSPQIYVDTNCFLHLRDLRDLPWRDLFPGPSIDIVVAPIVIDELDRLKVERSGRVRDRARAALHIIEAASAEPGMRLQLREAPHGHCQTNGKWRVLLGAPETRRRCRR